MFYEPHLNNHGLPHDPFKALVAPRPIGWISVLGKDGSLNLSPYSFFNALAGFPPIVGFSSEGRKDAVTFVEETREFVCNIVPYSLREEMNKTSAPLPRGMSEFDYAGLEQEPSKLVMPPRVKGVPAALECKLLQIVSLTNLDGEFIDRHLVIGQVVGIYIDEQFIKDGLVDTAAMEVIARAGYHDYFVATPETKFAVARP